MQVSWIDPEEVASLAESLRPTARHQTKVVLQESTEAAEPLVSDQPGTEAGTEAELPDLSAFRQRLQAIREKAITAGLLTPQTAPSPPAAEAAPPTPPTEVSASEPTPEPAQEIPALEQPANLLEESSPAPAAAEPVFTPPPPPQIPIDPGASVKERLEAFAQWAALRWEPSELLIVDEYGDLLWGPPKKSGLVVSTMMAWNAAIRASAQAASGMTQTHQQSLNTGETLTIIPCQTRLGLLQIAVIKSLAPTDSEITTLREALAEVMNIVG
ncbi:MAG: hypothetical protein OJI67_13560 [Prosthecobacter sp.]|nr:hypothetical protein [Prosthecobacter sp.]